MFKKFLLYNARKAGLMGFAVSALSLILIAGIVMAVSSFHSLAYHEILFVLAMSLTCAILPVGILMALVCRYYRRHYVSHVDDFREKFGGEFPADWEEYSEDWPSGKPLLLLVKDGKVVTSGKAVWSKYGKGVYLVVLPHVSSDYTFDLTVPVSPDAEAVKCHLRVYLSGDFNLQELYDHPVCSGYHSVVNWLSEQFTLSLIRAGIPTRIEAGARLERYQVANWLSGQLKKLRVACPLSNVVSIKANVVVESIPGYFQVIYARGVSPRKVSLS